MLVERPRVERRLREAVAHASLTLLQAPIGAGKTSSALSAFGDVSGVVWMDARPWHRGSFIPAIVEAIRSAREDFGRLTLGALEAGASATYLGKLFASELAHVRGELYLIVDNSHVFAGDERFRKFVDAAVSELPETVRILAIGRSLAVEPLVKSLSRGRITILDGELLTLDRGEMREFGRAFGRELDDSELLQLVGATEGWAAGVALVLATAGGLLPVTARHTLRELGRESLPFLEDVAVFEALDLRVLTQHRDYPDAHERLSELQRRGASIAQVGEQVYRINPLLREALLSRIRNTPRERAAHRNAAASYLRAGEIGAAIYHAERAGDSKTAADVLRSYVDAAFASGDYSQIRALIERIDVNGPDAAIRLYTEALFEKASGAGGARDLFMRAAKAANDASDEHVTFNALAQILEHDIGKLSIVEDERLAELSRLAGDLGTSAQANALMLRGWAYAVRHQFDAALSTIAPLKTVREPRALFNAEILRAYAQTAIGEVDDAQATLDATAEFLEDGKNTVLQTLTLVWFARLALLWGRTNVAADAASHASRLSELLHLRAEEAALFVAQAEIATHTGDMAAAVRYAERASACAGRAWYAADKSRVDAFAGIVLARVAFLGRDNSIARDLALRVAEDPAVPSVQRALALAEASMYTLLCAPEKAAQIMERTRDGVQQAIPVDAADAVYLSSADDILAFLDEANGKPHQSLLENCRSFSKLLELRRGLVTLQVAGIAVGNMRRGTAEGTAAFETALTQLQHEGPRFEAMLARAYASTFIKPKEVSPPRVAGPALTSREREILTLLVEGLSNKEIALRLVVSPRTIETHVERVLGKLEVGSRSRAIAKAVRLGLVALENS